MAEGDENCGCPPGYEHGGCVFSKWACPRRANQEPAWDIDKLVGAVIDAYTLAPNDEDEKREAVKATIGRSGWERVRD